MISLHISFCTMLPQIFILFYFWYIPKFYSVKNNKTGITLNILKINITNRNAKLQNQIEVTHANKCSIKDKSVHSNRDIK